MRPPMLSPFSFIADCIVFSASFCNLAFNSTAQDIIPQAYIKNWKDERTVENMS